MIARIAVYLALIGLSVLQAAYYQPRLPAVVASHFNAAGQPDAWASREEFTRWCVMPMCILGFLFLITEGVVRAFVRWGPKPLAGSLSEEQAGTHDRIGRKPLKVILDFLFPMGLLVMLLVLTISNLEIRANLSPPPVLRHMWLVLGVFLAAVLALLVRMGLKMRRLVALLPARKLRAGVWFPAKRWGWGWGPPCCWQGWAFMVVWAVMTVAGTLWLAVVAERAAAGLWLPLGFAAAMGAIMIIVCYLKGERPRWRWGE